MDTTIYHLLCRRWKEIKNHAERLTDKTKKSYEAEKVKSTDSKNNQSEKQEKPMVKRMKKKLLHHIHRGLRKHL